MSKNTLCPDTNPEATAETCRVCKGTCFLPLSNDPGVYGVAPCFLCRGKGTLPLIADCFPKEKRLDNYFALDWASLEK